MPSIEEVNLKTILPKNGPSIEEVKKYLEKYNDEKIIIKCGGSVLIDPNLFNLFIQDVVVMKNLGLSDDQLKSLTINAIQSSFCGSETKTKLLDKV